MNFESAVHQGIQGVVDVMRHLHFPIMDRRVRRRDRPCALSFTNTVKRHEWFAREFEKRVNRYLEDESEGAQESVSFYVIAKRLFEKTFYEDF